MDILDLIPQRPPIVMVDRFLGFEDGVSHTEFAVSGDNILVEEGHLTECGLIEHIAQSAAARVGHVFRSEGKEVPVGYIGSVNKFTIDSLPPAGCLIRTEIKVIQEVMGISLIEAECKVDGRHIAGCRMKIFLDTDGKEKGTEA